MSRLLLLGLVPFVSMLLIGGIEIYASLRSRSNL